MIVSINQPAYLPWLGYFHRIAASDLHIVLDHVQFEKNSFANRNKIRTADGWAWLTVPVKTKGKFGQLPLNGVETAAEPAWRRKHWSAIRQHYGRAKFFDDHAPFFEEAYARPWTRLNDLVNHLTRYQLEAFGIGTPLAFSSEMRVSGCKDELVLNLCKAVGAKVYLSGPLGRDYLRTERFEAAGIRVIYHDYPHPVYPQVYPGFEPYMAGIDLLFNCGPASLDVLSPASWQAEALNGP